MCKFHILGACARGDNCLYAHSKEQLVPLPDLSYTKLCPTLIRFGQCMNPNCKFAHDRDELRTSATRRGSKLCKINVHDQALPATRGKGARHGALEENTGGGSSRHVPLGTWDEVNHAPHEQADLRFGSGVRSQDMTGMAASMHQQAPPAAPEGRGSKYGWQPGLVYAAWSLANYAAGVPGLGASNSKVSNNVWTVSGCRGEEAASTCAETADRDLKIVEENTSPESVSSEEVLAQQQLGSQDHPSGSDAPDDEIFSSNIMATQYRTYDELEDVVEEDAMLLPQGPCLPQFSFTTLQEAKVCYFDDIEGIKVSVKNTFLQFDYEQSNVKRGLRKVLSTGGRLDQLGVES